MKWIRSVKDFKNLIIENKRRTGQRHLNTSTAEKPRVIYDRFCLQIANELEDEGFTYFPSKHKLKFVSIDKKYILFIQFSTSNSNMAGEYVQLSVSFSIESKELRKFSKNNPLLTQWSQIVIARDFGVFLDKDVQSCVWNIVNDVDYENAILTIPDLVRNSLFPLFERFQNSEFVVEGIESGKFDLNTVWSTVQYLLSFGRKDVAENFLSEFLKRKPHKILDDYKSAVKVFATDGLPDYFVHGMGYGHEIALLAEVYNLNLTVPKLNC